MWWGDRGQEFRLKIFEAFPWPETVVPRTVSGCPTLLPSQGKSFPPANDASFYRSVGGRKYVADHYWPASHSMSGLALTPVCPGLLTAVPGSTRPLFIFRGGHAALQTLNQHPVVMAPAGSGGTVVPLACRTFLSLCPAGPACQIFLFPCSHSTGPLFTREQTPSIANNLPDNIHLIPSPAVVSVAQVAGLAMAVRS